MQVVSQGLMDQMLLLRTAATRRDFKHRDPELNRCAAFLKRQKLKRTSEVCEDAKVEMVCLKMHVTIIFKAQCTCKKSLKVVAERMAVAIQTKTLEKFNFKPQFAKLSHVFI